MQYRFAVNFGTLSTFTCRSIGYKSVQAEANLPFDAKKGVVPNEGGRVEPGKGSRKKFLFFSGPSTKWGVG